MSEDDKKSRFTGNLMHWHRHQNKRALIWKDETDPYKIWLSEIILQQTRAEQGKPYYISFTGAYPTVTDLANAPDEEVFRLWQGLGYYNRCKNLLATARYIAEERGGKFPDTYEEIIALKGVGAYTSAAIASFAFGLPYAVVDGNVVRVLARYFGIYTAADTTEGKKHFAGLAQELLYKEKPGGYNQAIMDYGATICVPVSPLCNECILQPDCTAYNEQQIAALPAKTKKPVVKKRYLHYLLLQRGDKVWIQKRTGKDIWQNLYQPFLIEADEALDKQSLTETEAYQYLGAVNQLEYEGHLKQRLTHQLIEIRFFSAEASATSFLPDDGIWVQREALKNYGFPRSVVSFLSKKEYF